MTLSVLSILGSDLMRFDWRPAIIPRLGYLQKMSGPAAHRFRK
jgi:hypothetical protein